MCLAALHAQRFGRPPRDFDGLRLAELVLIGSPPCVAFSQLQALIPDSERKAKQLAEGIRHMEFMAKPYKKAG